MSLDQKVAKTTLVEILDKYAILRQSPKEAKVSTQTKAKTIHRYRETEQYKKLASLLEGYSQHTIDNLYMSLAGNSLSRELLEEY